MDVLDLKNAEIIPLSEENIHLCHAFDCGDSDLNEFLLEDALDHNHGKIAITYLFIYEGRVLGFFCLSMFAIKPTEEALEILKERGKPYTLFPALLIARLGVDEKSQGQGIGREIIETIIGIALKESDKIGCRFIVVDAYENAVPFYENKGFKQLSKERKKTHTVKMYLDLLREF